MASRFGNEAVLYYDSGGTANFGGTQIYFTQSKMPQYPFEEYRVTDLTQKRNLDGGLYSFKNYVKLGYIFKWHLLDETCAGQLRQMADTNSTFIFSGDTINFWGTFRNPEYPTITEVQFGLYDITMKAEEV